MSSDNKYLGWRYLKSLFSWRLRWKVASHVTTKFFAYSYYPEQNSLDLRKMFITLVMKGQKSFYLHHLHIIILPILFCVCHISIPYAVWLYDTIIINAQVLFILLSLKRWRCNKYQWLRSEGYYIVTYRRLYHIAIETSQNAKLC